MNDVLSRLLACPRCKGRLILSSDLRCAACNVSYPIRDGIPRMSDGAETRDERMVAEWNAQAEALPYYSDRAVIMNRWEEQVLPRLLDWSGVTSGVVLDAGCGVGHLGSVFATMNRSELSLVGMDFQSELLREAGQGYAGLLQADIHHLPIKDGAIDAVIASNSLHHFPDPGMAMAEIARVLRPGGVFVAYDPRFVAPLESLKRLLRRNDPQFTQDHKAFRLDEYRRLLSSSGLIVTEIRRTDPIGPLVATALDYLKVGRMGIAGAAATVLSAIDSAMAGSSGTTGFGLMLAGRAIKPSSVPHPFTATTVGQNASGTGQTVPTTGQAL